MLRRLCAFALQRATAMEGLQCRLVHVGIPLGDVDEKGAASEPEKPQDAVTLGGEGSLLSRVEQMSRKKQQFTLSQELRDRSDLRDDGEEDDRQARTMDMVVIHVNRTVKVTKGGSLQRFSALVVVGNGDGVVGWASGKAPEVGTAIDKAYARASRSLFFFERFEEHTIFHSAKAKYGRSLVELAPLPSGSGLRANTTVAAVCKMAGIKDIRAKVHGSHNPGTTLRAIFEALDSIRSPDEISAMRGRAVVAV